MLEEAAELLGTPHLHLGRQALGEVGHGGDVARHIAPAHGISKGGMEHAVDVSDRLWRQPTAAISPSIVQ
jgi:hypothetical protein